jgi:hypothetical protein
VIDPARFWRRVRIEGSENDDACWIWIGNLNSRGAGRIRSGPALLYAHRVAYELQVGQIPHGYALRHLDGCDPACVRGSHLRLDRPHRKLGESERQILRRWLKTAREASLRFGVSERHIRRVRNGL